MRLKNGVSFTITTLESSNGKQRLDKIARNLVDYEAGKTILDTAMGVIIKQNVKQTELF